MGEITRFDIDMDGSMEPSEHGQWVRYEDAQRTWVGLTDEEKKDLCRWWSSPMDAIYATETKLKEKNSA